MVGPTPVVLNGCELTSCVNPVKRKAMRAAIVALWLILLATGSQPAGAQSVMDWANEFPRTDFSRSIVSFTEIRFDGPRRDTIPPILDPKFEPASRISNMGRLEPVKHMMPIDDFAKESNYGT